MEIDNEICRACNDVLDDDSVDGLCWICDDLYIWVSEDGLERSLRPEYRGQDGTQKNNQNA